MPIVTSAAPLIQVQNVCRHFQVGEHNVPILKHISFDVHAGEFVAIVGPSGNGKSTLLNMITGIDHPNQGAIIVAGHQIHRMNENQLAAWRSMHVGIIFQFFQMLPALSLLKNVMLPMDFAGKCPPRMRRQQALDLLELVGLTDQADKLPGMVSGGQQQRAAIARALANDPPLLIGDEPTGNLDAHTARTIFELFRQLVAQSKTMMMVTHDRELAQQSDRYETLVEPATYQPRLHFKELPTKGGLLP